MVGDDIRDEIVKIPNNHVLLEWATGTGKSRAAIERLDALPKKDKVLIFVPRLILIKGWKNEFKLWGYERLLKSVTFSTYYSIEKHKGKWDVIIFDEVHHLSPRCRNILCEYQFDYSILLSATVGYDLKQELKYMFKNLYCYQIRAKEAIDNGMLPDPKVILIPLKLDDTLKKEMIIKNPTKNTKPIVIDYSQRWKYIRNKTDKIIINCTQKQRYDDFTSMVDWYKNKFMSTRNEVIRGKWMRVSKDRLDWLSSIKNKVILDILKELKSERTLVFCSDIAQTEALGEYCINSKNERSNEYLQMFNEGKIDHITSCNILNEGANLVNCKIGIYANLNSSETIINQRLGRLLRHPKPVIIIPYFVGTRDNEIVNTMLENYNKDLIKGVFDIKKLKSCI